MYPANRETVNQKDRDPEDIDYTEATLDEFSVILENLQYLNDLNLLRLREMVDQHLPERKLATINLEDELVGQYQMAKALQLQVLNDNEESSKKATVMNACTSSLQNLIKMQTDLFAAERFKQVETHLIHSLNMLSVEAQRAFIDAYGSDTIIKKDDKLLDNIRKMMEAQAEVQAFIPEEEPKDDEPEGDMDV